jgi:phospholipase/carboxylesterase
MPRSVHLHTRTKASGKHALTGLQVLPGSGRRDSYLYVPNTHPASIPHPLALLLHGAGGHAQHGLELLWQYADETGLILVAPASNGVTWDAIAGVFGADVMRIEQELRYVFERYAIDAAHLAIGGFSDGASYALSLGLGNGDLFTHVIAFSPGFMTPSPPRGQPRIFISHGTQDPVLPIDVCSRKIVPRLKDYGYEVAYHEFPGPHSIPPDVARSAVDWFLGDAVS